MAKNILLLSLATFFVLLQTAYAAEFLCADEPAVCKTKFGKQFEKDFKELHLNASRKQLETFIGFANTLKSEQPADDLYTIESVKLANIISSNLKTLNDNLDDVATIKGALAQSMEYAIKFIDLGLRIRPAAEKSESLVEKYHIQATLTELVREMMVDTANLWAEMYKGLRDIDLKAYTEFSDINEYMENLRGNAVVPSADFVLAVKKLALNFDLPYFEDVMLFEFHFVIRHG